MAGLAALTALGTLVGLLDDTDGTVQWLWLGDPVSKTLTGVVDNRAQIGALIGDLASSSEDDADFDDAHGWKVIATPAGVELGIAWSTGSTDSVQIGLGAKAQLDQEHAVALLAHLFEIDKSGPTGPKAQPMLGDVSFDIKAPVPILESAHLQANLGADAPAPAWTVDVTSNAFVTKTMKSDSAHVDWDCIRLATFVATEWSSAHATPGSAFRNRLNEHLVPMMQGTPVPSDPLPHSMPQLGDMGTPGDFTPWTKSLFSPDASGALTFLWHARALLTGNESSQFLPGSAYFPLGPAPGVVQLADGPGPSEKSLNGGPPAGEPTASGAYLGIQDDATATRQIVLLCVMGGTTVVRLVLARFGASGPVPIGQASSLPLSKIATGSWTLAAGNSIVVGADPDVAGGHIVELKTNGVGDLPSDLALQLSVDAKLGVTYQLAHGPRKLNLPPNGADPFLIALDWMLADLPSGGAQALAPMLTALAKLVAASDAAARRAAALTIATTIAKLWSPSGGPMQIGPLSLGVGQPGKLNPKLTIGPIAVGDADTAPVHIGKAVIDATVAMPGNVEAFSVSLIDVRLGNAPGALPAGLAASLIPDLRKLPGFGLTLTWSKGVAKVEGGGRIPIQKTLGPLEIASLLVDVRDDSFSVAIDLGFKLSVIKVQAVGLGVRFPLTSKAVPANAEVFLHGIGISLDTGAVTLRGMFAEVQTPPKAPAAQPTTDYVGGAVVSVAGLFDLTAIGGYTTTGGQASLFVFASLRAPLGGPPFFFVTGVAGGFGYNRSLPPNTPASGIEEHPFFKVMNGDIDIDAGPSVALERLSAEFAPALHEHWLAGGIEFTCFGFINGKILVTVAFGHDVSVAVMGLGTFSILPIAYFQLAIEALIDKERVLVAADISPSSYIIDPSFFSLRGGFALGVWHGGVNAGDFVLSVGGYHKAFRRPEHYPAVNRVGVTVGGGSFTISVQCFFTCTPKALMAGAALSLSGRFGPISAGLDVHVDVLIEWDPFFISAQIGVCVWFVFFGRHEISVELEIHTPKFGGVARVKIFIVSFKIRFGAQLDKPPGPPLDEIFTRQIGVPATGHSVATLNAFNTAEQAGLFKVEITSGRSASATPPEPSTSSAQEGVEGMAPLLVEPEFTLNVLTRLPLDHPSQHGVALAPADDVDPPVQAAPAQFELDGAIVLDGEVSLPLWGSTHLVSQLRLSGLVHDGNQPRGEWLADHFPAAVFGPPLVSLSAALESLGIVLPGSGADGAGAVVSLHDGVALDYTWHEPATPALIDAADREESDPEQDYPLPLGAPDDGLPTTSEASEAGVVFVTPGARSIAPRAPVIDRRRRAMAARFAQVAAPLRMRSRQAAGERLRVATRMREMTVRRVESSDVAMTPPLSPMRRAELFGVSLRVQPARNAAPVEGEVLRRLRRARNVAVDDLTPREENPRWLAGRVRVQAGQVAHLDVAADRLTSFELSADGEQTVRAILLGQAGDLIGDVHLHGSGSLSLSSRIRRVVLFGEGFSTPFSRRGGFDGRTPAAPAEPVGVAGDTVLVALTRRLFAGHGCVVRSHTALPFAMEALDSVPGATLLAAATRFTLSFPFTTEGTSLVLTVAPTVSDPGTAAEGVRWRSDEATLGELSAVVGADETALVMSVEAAQAWALELDFSPNWRLTAAHVSPVAAGELTRTLHAGGTAGRIDDRLVSVTEKTASDVTVEVGT